MGLQRRLLIVNSIPRRVVALVRWVLAPEQLPPYPGESDRNRVRPACFVEQAGLEAWAVDDRVLNEHQPRPRRFLPWLLSAQELPTLLAAPRGSGRGQSSFWSWLVSDEHLSEQNAGGTSLVRRQGFLRWLLSGTEHVGDRLPKGQKKRAARFFSWVLCRDELPASPGLPLGALGRPQRFWRWLIGGEHLPELKAGESRLVRRHGSLHSVCSPEDCPQIRTPFVQRRTGFLTWVFSRENL